MKEEEEEKKGGGEKRERERERERERRGYTSKKTCSFIPLFLGSILCLKAEKEKSRSETVD